MSGAVRSGARHLAVGLLLVLAALPLTSSDSSGPQADNLVLGLLAAAATVRAYRRTRGMRGRTALPWRLMVGSGALFAAAGLLTGTGLSSAFGGVGVGDLLLVPAVLAPPVVCALLAAQVRTAHWPALLLDAASVVLTLAVLYDVFLLAPPGPAGASAQPLSVVYVLCATLLVGSAAALGSVATHELRRSSRAMLVGSCATAAAVVLVALGAGGSGLAVQGLGDAAVLVCLETGVLAIAVAPRRMSPADDVVARSPRVDPLALGLVVVTLFGLPVGLVVAVLRGTQLSPPAMAGTAVALVLLLLRSTLRARAGERLVADLVRSEQDFRDLVETSTDGVVIVDDDLRLRFTSPVARAMLGLPADRRADERLVDRVLPADRARVLGELRAGVSPVLHVRVDDGDPGGTELEVTQHERAGRSSRVLHLRDVTVHRRRERELEQMAYTDHLTQLPNRAVLFRETAREDVGAAQCMLVLDLDGFKAVNDQAGHEDGDQLLVEVAVRLRSSVRDRDLVTRLGGDEFAVVVEGDLDDATETAQRLIDALSRPYRTQGGTFAVGASVGVAVLRPGGGQLAFRQADDALRAAKRAGKGCLRVWDGDGGDDLAGLDVAAALVDGSVEIRYTLAGRPGARLGALHAEPVWRRPDGDLLAPADLWAAAGRQGQDAALQRWMLGTAADQVAGLPTDAVLALDLPAGHLCPDRLVDDVITALHASGLPARRLSLALTEDALLTSSASLAPALHQVHALGVRICLDDYGMGQSLFSHLARVPLTTIRVDVTALGGGRGEEHTLKVMRSLVSTADTFGLATIAHGISPGPLMDAVLDCGVHMVRTRENLRHASLQQVHELLTAVPGERVLDADHG